MDTRRVEFMGAMEGKTIQDRLAHGCHVVVSVTALHMRVFMCVGRCLWVFCSMRQDEARGGDLHALVVVGGVQHIHQLRVPTVRLPNRPSRFVHMEKTLAKRLQHIHLGVFVDKPNNP